MSEHQNAPMVSHFERQGGESIPNTSPLLVHERTPSNRCLLSLVVVMLTSCLCIATIALSGFGGYQDELDDIQTEDSDTQVAELATQYQLALEDEAAGIPELAADRYEYIITQEPGYQDAAQRLNQVRVVLSYTPTPQPTDTTVPLPTTVVTTTATLEPTHLQPSPTITPDGPDIAKIFDDAQKLFNAGLYEDAIEFFDIVIQLDPEYRRSEVDSMLFVALREQAQIYFDGRNLDDGSNGVPGDQLVRGVQLARRALDMAEANPQVGDREDLPFEWFLVDGYVAARNFLAGNACVQAQTILNELCSDMNCAWGYRGVTVQDLLDRANTCS